MKRKIILFFSLFFVLFSTNAFAHTELESSNPSDGAKIISSLSNFTLTFEEKIESEAKVTVTNQKNESLELSSLKVVGNELKGSFPKRLENGKYQLNWTVVADDGHPVNGNVSFTVDMPTSKALTGAKIVKHTKVTTNKTVVNTKTTQSNWVKPVSYIGGSILILLVGFLILYPRKK
jgi:hypothetical protein